MNLPKLTALQFAIIEVLRGSTMKGRVLRAKLAERGIRFGGSSFYPAMSRLEDSGFVKATTSDRVVLDMPVTEASYRILKAGEQAYLETLAFYTGTQGQRVGRPVRVF